MFQLRSFLGKIDKTFVENEDAVSRRRAELDCCHDRQRFLERERSRLQKALDEAKNNVAASSRLQAEMLRVVRELESEADLESQIRTQLRQAEYDLSIADVQQGRMNLVNAELKQLETQLSIVQEKDATKRIKREREMTKNFARTMDSRNLGKEKQHEMTETELERRQKSARAAYIRAAKAREGLNAKLAIQKEAEAEKMRHDFHKRTQAILELKEDIEKNKHSLSAIQARRKADAETVEAEQQVLREEFKKQGLHPDQQLLVRKRLKALEDAKALVFFNIIICS